jgi:transposase, IS5 family
LIWRAATARRCATAAAVWPSARRSWVGRYRPARQFKRARRALKFLRIRLGRVIRDIRRKIAGDPKLNERFAGLLGLAGRGRFQDHRRRRPKVDARHAPEVEGIGKAKARAPDEFGCKASIATPATKPTGGRFARRAKALHGNPFDGHASPGGCRTRTADGRRDRRIQVDKGYRGPNHGHNHGHKFRVWITGQTRRVTRPIRREVKRRAAVEPVIGHLKTGRRRGRNDLKARDGDRANAVRAAAGDNFALLRRWLRRLWRALLQTLHRPPDARRYS